jgi:hypothetical protein
MLARDMCTGIKAHGVAEYMNSRPFDHIDWSSFGSIAIEHYCPSEGPPFANWYASHN